MSIRELKLPHMSESFFNIYFVFTIYLYSNKRETINTHSFYIIIELKTYILNHEIIFNKMSLVTLYLQISHVGFKLSHLNKRLDMLTI